MQSVAVTASILYLVDAGSAIATGLLSDVWIRKGYTPALVRKTVMAIGYTIACVAMVGFAAGPQIYLPWLMAAGVGCGMAGSGIFAFTQTLAGPRLDDGPACKMVSQTLPAWSPLLSRDS